MSIEVFESQNEDPSKHQREELIDALKNSVLNEHDEALLEKFRKGVFLVPSETTQKVSELIDAVPDGKEQKRLRALYTEILSHQ